MRKSIYPALRRSIESRYGSLEAYAKSRTRERDAALTADMNAAADAYAKASDALLPEIRRAVEETYPDQARAISRARGLAGTLR